MADVIQIYGQVDRGVQPELPSQEPQENPTMQPDGRLEPTQVLTEILARLSHLDLSGKVAKIGTHGKSGGSYSDIFQGRLLSSGTLVAIRELRAHVFSETDLKKSIALELRIWSDLDHPNILPLLGFSLEFGPHPTFVTEWMSNGTVLDYVKANPEASVLELSIGIAAGLEYLHEKEIVHADVKSSNVLVSPTGVPLLIDFGLSRLLVISQIIMTTREAGGTFRWMAYELCGGIPPGHMRESIRTVATKETDVWAYGMTVLELLTKSYPYSHLKTDCQVFSAIGKGSLPRRPSNLTRTEDVGLWEDICNPCWSRTASGRPTMSDLLKVLFQLNYHNIYSSHSGRRDVYFHPSEGIPSDMPDSSHSSSLICLASTSRTSLHLYPASLCFASTTRRSPNLNPTNLDPTLRMRWDSTSQTSLNSNPPHAVHSRFSHTTVPIPLKNSSSPGSRTAPLSITKFLTKIFLRHSTKKRAALPTSLPPSRQTLRRVPPEVVVPHDALTKRHGIVFGPSCHPPL